MSRMMIPIVFCASFPPWPRRRRRARCSWSPGWTARPSPRPSRRDWPTTGRVSGEPSGAKARPPDTFSTSTASSPTAIATPFWSRYTRTESPATRARGPASSPGSREARRRPRRGRARPCSRWWSACSSRARWSVPPAPTRRPSSSAERRRSAALGGEGDGRVVSEVADLWFHSMVLLASRGIPLRRVFEELARRHGEKSTA